VAIGHNAGRDRQNANAIAIGAFAGQTNQGANSIIINASGATFAATTANACFISPIRSAAGTSTLNYNSTTYEVTYVTSSRATKNTIEDLTMETGVLHDLKPRTYLYNSDPGAGKQVGYIAEEVADINKHFATYNEPDGPPVAINWNTISVFLVEEMKKLKRENEDLMARVLALENR
jgi:hypothetical protein